MPKKKTNPKYLYALVNGNKTVSTSFTFNRDKARSLKKKLQKKSDSTLKLVRISLSSQDWESIR